MSLETIFKLSVIVNMIDNLTATSRSVNMAIDENIAKYESMQKTYSTYAKTGAMVALGGATMAKGVLAPVEATYETQKAFGELRSVGIENLEAIENAAIDFTNTWSGFVKSEFISSAYDIKSGISSLTDEGVAQYTSIANLTAKATKATSAEMTSLFATGYGIYKDYYSDLTDLEFAEIFSAGIAQSVKQFKTTGSQMSQSISSLGQSATNAQVPLEEQLSILGMLQQTMSGSEAGTKYKAFLKSAAKAGDELGLSFVDANDQLLSLPEILTMIQAKYGDTLDAVEKLELQKAFGTEEAIAMLDIFYSKTNDLEQNIMGLNSSLSEGTKIANGMATVMNQDPGSKWEIVKQKGHNLKELIGNGLAPTIEEFTTKIDEHITNLTNWIQENEKLASIIMNVLFILSLLTIGVGSVITLFGIVGMIGSNAAIVITKMLGGLKLLGSGFETVRIAGMLAKDSIFKFASTTLVSGLKAAGRFTMSLLGMAKQAIVTAVSAMPGLIASVWSFTAALLANPITWIILGIVALVAAIILLWKNWDKVCAWISGVWNAVIGAVIGWFQKLKEKLTSVPNSILLVLAAFVPFIGIPLLIIKNWDSIKAFFSNLIPTIINWFKELPTKIKEKFDSMLSIFKESGKKIMETLGQGILNGVTAPYEAVKGALDKVRQLLPFSDAKEGPLSELTLSGRKVFETLNVGMEQSAPVISDTASNAFDDFNDSMSVEDQQVVRGMSTASSSKSENKLTVHIHFDKVLELKEVIRFIQELNEYKEAFGDEGIGFNYATS